MQPLSDMRVSGETRKCFGINARTNSTEFVPTARKTRAFAYLRVSGKGQIEGDGFPRQRAAIKAYAEAHQIKIVRWFEEQGVSGTVEGMERPTWAEMVGLIMVNGVRTIIVESLSRLSRQLFIQEYILRDMAKRGIPLISASEPDLESSDPTRVMFRQILGSVHEYERSMIVAKLAGARARKRAKLGRCEGRKPFGFRPGEAGTLERMKALRAAGLSFDRIAQELNTQDLKPRLGARWHGVVINRILSGHRAGSRSQPT